MRSRCVSEYNQKKNGAEKQIKCKRWNCASLRAKKKIKQKHQRCRRQAKRTEFGEILQIQNIFLFK